MNTDKFDNENPKKLIQIIGVPRPVFVVYKNDDGSENKVPVLFAGLQANGDLMFLDCDVNGFFEEAADVGNFLRFEIPV